MSRPNSDVPASNSAPAIEPHANQVGDLVVSDGLGEIVLLPRLWGFIPSSFSADRIELVDGDGLTAVCRPDGSGGVRLTEVGSDPAAAASLALAAS